MVSGRWFGVILGVFTVTAGVLISGCTGHKQEAQAVSPASTESAAIIRQTVASQLGKLPGENLTPDDWLKVKKLDLGCWKVSDLSALAGLKNLEEIELSGPVPDIAPLAALSKLKKVDLSETSNSDLKPLAKLKNLERLDLMSAPVSDLRPLAELKNLERLGPHR